MIYAVEFDLVYFVVTQRFQHAVSVKLVKDITSVSLTHLTIIASSSTTALRISAAILWNPGIVITILIKIINDAQNFTRNLVETILISLNWSVALSYALCSENVMAKFSPQNFQLWSYWSSVCSDFSLKQRVKPGRFDRSTKRLRDSTIIYYESAVPQTGINYSDTSSRFGDHRADVDTMHFSLNHRLFCIATTNPLATDQTIKISC